jgi:hypothetical protein
VPGSRGVHAASAIRTIGVRASCESADPSGNDVSSNETEAMNCLRTTFISSRCHRFMARHGIGPIPGRQRYPPGEAPVVEPSMMYVREMPDRCRTGIRAR